MLPRAVSMSLTFSVMVLFAGAAQAAGNPDNGPGCGLGKLAWMDYASQKQIAPQVMMATTNGTFGSQTFGISSGTSGCTNDGIIMKNKHVSFTSATFEDLGQEMAQGQGEHLTSLATLLGVAEKDQPAFFALVQEKYTSLMESGRTTPLAMLQVLQAAMAQDPVLAKAAVVSDPSYGEVK
jgi:DUF3015 family protein